MIKKVNKSFNNLYGIEEVRDNIFEKPCIIGIFPEDQNKRQLNGYLNKIMYLLQIRHFDDIDSDYDINSVPFNVLGYTKDDDIAKMILDLIPENDINLAKKIIRNVNIMSYCRGNDKTNDILVNIYNGLTKEKHYSENEAKDIMKEIFVLQIVDNYIVNHNLSEISYATSIIIHNIDDDENYQYKERENELFSLNELIKEDDKDKRKTSLFLYRSFGEGSLHKEYREHSFSDDYIYSPVLNAFMSTILINVLNLSLKRQSLNKDDILKNYRSILQEADDYIKRKQKPLNEYSKEDLKEFNDYIMKIIQKYSIQEFNLQLLTEDEKNKLNLNDKIINEYVHLNKYNHAPNISDVENIINQIFHYYDNFDKSDILEKNVNSVEYISVESIIKKNIEELINIIKKILKYIDNLKLPNETTKEIRDDYNKYIKKLLKELSDTINNDKLKMILEEYQVDDKAFKI